MIVRSLTAAIPSNTQPELVIKEIAFSTIISQHTKFEYCVFFCLQGCTVFMVAAEKIL